jgi:outer membrane protein TolC
MKRLAGLSTVVSVLVAGATGAQDPLPPARLSLEQAIEIGLARHPRLERLRHEVLAAEAGIREARARYYPWVSVQGVVKEGLSGATGGLGLWGLPASPFFDKVADSVNVSFDIYDFGRTGNRVEEARFTAASLRSQEDAEKARRIWQVKAAYYRCLQSEAL